MSGESRDKPTPKPGAPYKPPFFNRMVALVLVLVLFGVTALRLAHKVEIGRLPFDRFSVALSVIALLWFLVSLLRGK